MPDALRLSGLRELCNILNLHTFVGRIRRLRRIRHFTTSTCQQFENTGKNLSVLPPISHRDVTSL
ncbi:hypothetical protein BK239_02375 [Escherichia coli]|nr:hypothetical protein BB405_03230 [Escherichia coli]APK28435.1 hypothetical protein RG40_03385 [Escherichia coli]APK57434.1 hypothetical protein RG46_10030 [Escherichia coli]KHI29682.1 hypothetical protein PU34_14550 [Escherichia coli]KHO56745.1 hypothetical protein RT53_21125 [Escherichia coli]